MLGQNGRVALGNTDQQQDVVLDKVVRRVAEEGHRVWTAQVLVAQERARILFDVVLAIVVNVSAGLSGGRQHEADLLHGVLGQLGPQELAAPRHIAAHGRRHCGAHARLELELRLKTLHDGRAQSAAHVSLIKVRSSVTGQKQLNHSNLGKTYSFFLIFGLDESHDAHLPIAPSFIKSK
jgi:hypothetical protein